MSPAVNAMESLFEAEATHSQEVESLKRLLQEVREKRGVFTMIVGRRTHRVGQC